MNTTPALSIIVYGDLGTTTVTEALSIAADLGLSNIQSVATGLSDDAPLHDTLIICGDDPAAEMPKSYRSLPCMTWEAAAALAASVWVGHVLDAEVEADLQDEARANRELSY